MYKVGTIFELVGHKGFTEGLQIESFIIKCQMNETQKLVFLWLSPSLPKLFLPLLIGQQRWKKSWFKILANQQQKDFVHLTFYDKRLDLYIHYCIGSFLTSGLRSKMAPFNAPGIPFKFHANGQLPDVGGQHCPNSVRIYCAVSVGQVQIRNSDTRKPSRLKISDFDW